VLVGKNECVVPLLSALYFCDILRMYDLVLQTDVNTNGHTQWFFFRIENTVAGVRYKLNIINMMKRDSLYCSPHTQHHTPTLRVLTLSSLPGTTAASCR